MKITILSIIIFCCAKLILPQEKGIFTGQVFGDFEYGIQSDTSIASQSNTAFKSKKDSSAFQFRRIALGYDYKISEIFFSRIRIESDQATVTNKNRFGIFVKDAFLKWNNIFTGSDLIIGLQPTLAYETSESLWGHRFLEKTIMDLRGLEPSRDFGVSLSGRIDVEGVFNYRIMAGNGSANSPETDKYKKLYAAVIINPTDELSISLFADYTFKPAKTYMINQYQGVKERNDVFNSAFFISYSQKKSFAIGLETFFENNMNDNGAVSISQILISNRYAAGISLFTHVVLSDLFSIVLRSDYFDPNYSATHKNDSRFFYIAALDYKPNPSVIISPNVMMETFENTSVKPSVIARITFAWILQ